MPRFHLRLRTLMILVAAVAVALSFDATRRWLMAHWERDRDREVLEAAFRDILDPKNPENAIFLSNGGPLEQLVLDRKTYSSDHAWLILDRQPGDVAIPTAMTADFRRRNIGEGISVESFRFRDERIVIDDIDRFYAEGIGMLGADKFWKLYPKARGHISACLPGYSYDGEAAVVILDEGPSDHGMSWTILLKRSNGEWIATFRKLDIFE